MNLKSIKTRIGVGVLIMIALGLAQAVMYIDPPRIPTKAIGEQCTLKVRVRNAAGIYGWQAGFYFNPDVLEGISVAEDSFLKYAHGVNHSTLWFPQSFDNVNGVLKFCCVVQTGSDSGGVGDGPLMKVIIQVKATGSSILDLTEAQNSAQAFLCNSYANVFPFFCQDGFYGNENVFPTPSFAINTGTGHQIKPAVTWNSNANEFLVVWEEYLAATGNSDIKAQRVSSSGILLGSVINIESAALYHSFSPSVSWNGTNYLVAYIKRSLIGGDYNISGNTVSADGNTVGSPITICSDIRYQGDPVITWNGTRHLAVWEDRRNGWEASAIYGQLIDETGNLVGSNFLVVGNSITPSIISDGSNYLVVAQDCPANEVYGLIRGQRVDGDGNLIGSSFQIANSGAMPDVAFDGTNYLVVYQKPTSSIEWDIYGQRVSSTGSIVGSEFAINTASKDQITPRVIYEMASGKYLVNWVGEQSMPAIWRQAVNTNGTLFNGPSIQADASYQQIFPALAYGGNTGDMIVWADMRNGSNFDIYGYKQILIGVEENALRSTLNALRLEVYPNPFSKLANISFGIGQSAERIALKIYDSSGRLIRQFDHVTIKQYDQISWDGKDAYGSLLNGGVYFLHLKTEEGSWTKKIIISR